MPSASSEGLPPCVVRAAVFDGRQATWHDRTTCGTEPPDPLVQRVVAGKITLRRQAKIHSLYWVWPVLSLLTDDKTEAEAAYVRAEVYVRTGELP